MKSISITLISLALGLLASCSSGGDDEPQVIVPQDATLTLSVTPGSVQTRSASNDPVAKPGEAKINNIFAALFKADDTLLTSSYVDYSQASENTPDTIRISAKSDTPYTYVVIVNAGNLKFSNLEELKQATYNLQDIRVDNQPMCSQYMTDVTLSPGANYIGEEKTFPDAPEDAAFHSKAPIKVYRTASRIDFETITLQWSDADAADLKKANARFRLKRVYVKDVKSSTYLVDRELGSNNYSVELKENITYLNGDVEGKSGYYEGLNLFSAGDANAPIIKYEGSYSPTNDEGKWQCYITENTEISTPTTIILRGDILPELGDTPILKDRYFFIRLAEGNMIDTSNKKLPGVIRNYVIRINATITGKGSGDDTYRDNAYATVTVTPDTWAVEVVQEEVVN